MGRARWWGREAISGRRAAAKTAIDVLHLGFVSLPEPARDTTEKRRVDLRGTITLVRSVPGLPALIAA
ncbi:hypothetical protein [Actinoplanes sp. NPDC026619]|uniref:hypothetical protein n=1 Tax=Actinoplanes sp. NPDC026619 TaxID=3155798 RepID=UPI0033E2C02D